MKKATERKMNIAGGLMLGLLVAGVGFIIISNAVHRHRFHRDLLDSRSLSLHFAGPEDVKLTDPHAYAREAGLVVSGCLNRRLSGVDPVAQEVDVKVLSPAGTLLDETVIRDLSRCKLGGVHFNTKFATIPPEGSVLDIQALAPGATDTMSKPSSPDPDD